MENVSIIGFTYIDNIEYGKKDNIIEKWNVNDKVKYVYKYKEYDKSKMTKILTRDKFKSKDEIEEIYNKMDDMSWVNSWFDGLIKESEISEYYIELACKFVERAFEYFMHDGKNDYRICCIALNKTDVYDDEICDRLMKNQFSGYNKIILADKLVCKSIKYGKRLINLDPYLTVNILKKYPELEVEALNNREYIVVEHIIKTSDRYHDYYKSIDWFSKRLIHKFILEYNKNLSKSNNIAEIEKTVYKYIDNIKIDDVYDTPEMKVLIFHKNKYVFDTVNNIVKKYKGIVITYDTLRPTLLNVSKNYSSYKTLNLKLIKNNNALLELKEKIKKCLDGFKNSANVNIVGIASQCYDRYVVLKQNETDILEALKEIDEKLSNGEL